MNVGLIILLALVGIGIVLWQLSKRLLRHRRRSINALLQLLEQIQHRHELFGLLRDSFATFEQVHDADPSALTKHLLQAVGARERAELEPSDKSSIESLVSHEQLLVEKFDERLNQDLASDSLSDRAVDLLARRKTLDNQVAFSIQRYNSAVARYHRISQGIPLRFLASVIGAGELTPYQVTKDGVAVSTEMSFAL